MIHSIDLSSQEAAVGEAVTVVVHSDSGARVAISCFVDNPPPPRFKGCRECSVLTVQSGQSFEILPGTNTWKKDQGGYQITATTDDGDTRTVTVNVAGTSAGDGGAIAA